MALPMLTPEQRKDALENAAAARRRRAEVKTALKNRSLTLQEVFELADREPAIAKMRARTLLESLPRVGVHRAQLLMDDIGIAPSRRVRGLGRLQRQQIIDRTS